ncbi:MAG: hypothetical protein VX589_05815, partial [Myxococcota bacterium]|nr:hypothetical protein [Myxococcota bacterium]
TSLGRHPWFWIMPIDFTPPPSTETTRPVVIGAANNDNFEVLGTRTQPRRPRTDDGQPVGPALTVPTRAGLFGASFPAVSANCFPLDRADNDIRLLANLNLMLTETLTLVGPTVIDEGSVFVAATDAPMGATTVRIKIQYKTMNHGEFSVQVLVGLLNSHTPDRFTGTLASERLGVSADAKLNFDDLRVDDIGHANDDALFDAALRRNPTASVVDDADRLNVANPSPEALQCLTQVGHKEDLTRSRRRLVEHMLNGLLTMMSARAHVGSGMSAERAVPSPDCEEAPSAGGVNGPGMSIFDGTDRGGGDGRNSMAGPPSSWWTAPTSGENAQAKAVIPTTRTGGQTAPNSSGGGATDGYEQATPSSGSLPIIIIMLMTLLIVEIRRQKA